MRIRAISKSSCVRQDHEEMPAAEYSLAETKAELGERCPTRSFYEKPTEWLAARAGRDPFPVYCLVPNRNRRESEFAVRHGGLSEEWLRSTVAEIDSTRIHLWCLSFLEVSDHWLKSDRKYRRDLRRRRPPFHISQSDDASRDRCAPIARPQHKIQHLLRRYILRRPSAGIQDGRPNPNPCVPDRRPRRRCVGNPAPGLDPQGRIAGV